MGNSLFLRRTNGQLGIVKSIFVFKSWPFKHVWTRVVVGIVKSSLYERCDSCFEIE